MSHRPTSGGTAGATLVLDTGSPQASVALRTTGGLTISRTIELHRSSELLLQVVEEILSEAGEVLADLAGVLVLQGPGSFTGLRIGLATVLGWHQALGLRATAIPTLEVLASTQGEKTVIAVVDALRGDWTRQVYRHGRATGEPGLVAGQALMEEVDGPSRVVGFGVSRLEAEPWWRPSGAVELVESPPLAPAALALIEKVVWEPERLIAPIYFRPPAASLPKRRAQKKSGT